MNKLILLFILLAAPCVAEDAKTLLQEAQKLARDSKGEATAVSNAAALFDRVVAVEGATPAQQVQALTGKAQLLFKSNFEGAFASYFTKGIDQAAEAYRQILALPDCSNTDKIAAYQGLANCRLEKMDTNGANAALAEALQLPGLTDGDRFTATKNQADVLYRQLEFAKALPIYESLWSTNLPVNVRSGMENRIVEIVRREKGLDEAFKIVNDRFHWGSLGRAEFCNNNGRQAEAIQLYEGVLADAQADYRARFEALEKLLFIFGAKPDFAVFKANAEPRIAGLLAAEPKAAAIYQRLSGWPFRNLVLARDPDFKLWHAAKVHNVAALFEGYLQQRQFDQALAAAQTLLANTNTPATTRLACELGQIVLATQGKSAGVVDKVNAVLDQDAGLRTGQVVRAEALLKSARIAMDLRYEDVARSLYAARDKMLLPEPRRTLVCPFIPNGPKTITEIMQSSLYKDPQNRGRLDRKYGDNLQFLLETDAAITGRKVTSKEENFTPAEFVATCDEDGVKILLFSPSSKAKALADGLATMGGYEIYLAAGQEDPYDCYLVDLAPGGKNDEFNTQYNNAHFRRTRQDDRNLTIENRIFDNGVATLISVSWSACFNRLPKNGDAWDFEPIHWEQGGYSWGGSKSVHNRSSFGSLVFTNLTPENQNAIKRRLVAAAARVYRAALSANNGCVEIWQDPELGDQAFYFDIIKPMQTRLSSYLPKVKPEMTAADVEEVFAHAAQEWMNIEYVVAALRRDYLDARRIAGR